NRVIVDGMVQGQHGQLLGEDLLKVEIDFAARLRVQLVPTLHHQTVGPRAGKTTKVASLTLGLGGVEERVRVGVAGQIQYSQHRGVEISRRQDIALQHL